MAITLLTYYRYLFQKEMINNYILASVIKSNLLEQKVLKENVINLYKTKKSRDCCNSFL